MPTLLKDKKFTFASQALPQDAFGVVNFKGSEGFSTCYQFEIMLVSNDPQIDITTVLQNPAVFTILRNDGDIPFHGILAQFEQLQAVDDVVFYRALLVPKLWWLSLTHHNQIFLDKTIPEILEDVLKDGGLTTHDFQLKLENSYPSWEFICQYRESHLNFVSRWMEREGMYYYFEQSDAGEKMIITDTNLSHTPMAEGQTMYYSPPTGLDETHREEVIHAFILKQKLLPGKLHLQDYNYRTPSVNLSAEAPVSEQGRGEIHIYGEHFRTLQEGSGLSQIRVQELLSHEKRFHGESTIPYLRPGYRFDLERHYRDDFNQSYLTIELIHEGSQTGFLVSGIRQSLSATEEKPYYRNTFVTIPADVQYRHPKQTSKPSFNGTIHARIDAGGSGKYADLDEQGRYKVVLPFDLSGRKDGKASHWMRMAQPYAGENQGMHFPLHKHTEVLLTFIEGDPDRPIIAAAIPNPESPSPITGTNQTKSIIHSGRGPETSSVGAATKVTGSTDNNFIELEDDEYNEHIHIHTPGNFWREAQNRYGEYHAKEMVRPDTLAENLKKDTLLNKFGSDYNPTGMLDLHTKAAQGDFYNDVFKNAHVHVSSLDTVNTQEGNIYDFGGYWNYNLGNCYVENHIDQKAELNKKGDKDLLDKGGPDWSSFTYDTVSGVKLDDDFSNGNVWVEKKFGNSYDYVQGSSIEVTKGSSLEIQHGGKHIEWLYRSNGSKKHYEMRGGNKDKGEDKAEEKKWLSSGVEVYHKMVDHDFNETEIITHPLEGAYSYQYTTFPSWFTFKAGVSYIPQVSISTTASVNETSISAKAGTEISIAVQGALKADIGVFFGAGFELKTGASIGLDLDLRVGGAFVLKPSGGLKFDGVGFTARKEAALEAEKEEIKAYQAECRLGQMLAEITNNKARIKQNNIMIGDNRLDIRKAEGCIIL